MARKRTDCIKALRHAFANGSWSSTRTNAQGWWLKVGGSFQRGSLPFFSTHFKWAIMEAPYPSKVEISPVEQFNRTTAHDDHLDVYTAQMYVRT